MKKNVIALLLAALLTLSLTACNKGKNADKLPSTGSDLTWQEIEALAEQMLAEEQRN